MKVLVVKTSSMGDLIHTLPALTDASKAIEGIRFDWVAERSFSEIPHWHPAVDDVIVSDIRKWKKAPLASWFSNEYMAFRAALGSTDYDAVIDAQGLIKSAWLVARLAHGEVHGYDRKSARESLVAYTYNYTYPVAKDLHAVQRTRQLFAAALGYDLEGEPSAGINHSSESSRDVWLVHGTSRADKEWPEEYWRALAGELTQQGFRLHIPAGSEAEIARAHRIGSPFNATIWERRSLSEIKAAMENAHAVVAVDTGLAHLADALQVPLVMLFGPTNPGLVGPLSGASSVVQAASMNDINVEQIMDELNVEFVAD